MLYFSKHKKKLEELKIQSYTEKKEKEVWNTIDAIQMKYIEQI